MKKLLFLAVLAALVLLSCAAIAGTASLEDVEQMFGVASGCADESGPGAVHSVTFYDTDAEFPDTTPQKPQKINDGDKAVKPENPTKTGKEFICWTTDKEGTKAYNFSRPVTGDIKLYAKWGSAETPRIVVTGVQPIVADIPRGIYENLSHLPKVYAEIQPSALGLTLKYDWYECNANGEIIGNSLGCEAELTLADFPPIGKHYYMCIVSCEGCATEVSDIATLDVKEPSENDKLSFATQPEPLTTVTQGEITSKLTAVLAPYWDENGKYAPTLNWYECDKNGVVISESLATGGEFTIPTDLRAGNYFYICEAEMPWHVGAASDIAKVVVEEPLPPEVIITSQPTDKSIYIGIDEYLSDILSIEAEIIRDNTGMTLSYRWFECDENGDVSDARSGGVGAGDKLTLTSYPDVGTHYYICVVTGGGAIVFSNVAKVVVTEPPEDRKLAFTVQPRQLTKVNEGRVAAVLTVQVEYPQKEQPPTLGWYECEENGAIIRSVRAAGDSFALPGGLTVGTYYYRCKATLAGYADALSEVAKVVVDHPLIEGYIKFTTQPRLTQVTVGNVTERVTALAAIFPSELWLTPKYEWYQCDVKGVITGECLSTQGSFAVPDLGWGGTRYYKCAASYEGLETVYSDLAIVVYKGKPHITTDGELKLYVKSGSFSTYIKAEGASKKAKWSLSSSSKTSNGVRIDNNGKFHSDSCRGEEIYGTFIVRIRITDGDSYDEKDFRYTLYDYRARINIETDKLTDARVGEPYTQTLAIRNKKIISKPRCSISEGGKLPDGLEIDRKTGTISGTPTKSGTFSFTVHAENNYDEDDKSYNIRVLRASNAPLSGLGSFGTLALGEGGSFNLNPQNIEGLSFASLDTSVAKVDENGYVTAVGEGETTIVGSYNLVVSKKAATLNGDAISVKIHVVKDGMAVKSVSVSPGGVLAPGGKLALTASLSPETAQYKQLYWSSSDETVAEVDTNGVVTGVSPGSATITAMATSGVKASVSVTVTDAVKEIVLSKRELTLGAGQLARITATAYPVGAADSQITWSSDKAEIASVGDGLIIGGAAGKAVITALNPATGVKAQCAVTVVAGEVGAMHALEVINGLGSGEYRAGETVKITADAPQDGQRFKRWIPGSEDIVIAAPQSAETTLVMPAGFAFVGAEYEEAALMGISLSPTSRTMDIGDQYALSVIAQPADAALPIGITWQSDAPDVALVDESGAVTAVAPGKTVITALATSGATAKCVVTVR